MDKLDVDCNSGSDESSFAKIKSAGNLLECLLGTVSDAVIITNLELSILYTNNRASRMSGYATEELEGQRLDLLIPNLLNNLQWSDSERAPDQTSEQEICLQHKDGSLIDCILRIQTLSDPQKPEQRFLWVLHGMTRLKRAEERIKASEARLKEILHGVDTVAVQGYSMDGTVIFWNRASTHLYGYTEAEALGKNLLDLIIPDCMREAVIQEVATMTRTGKAMPSAELQLKRKDGALVDVYSSHAYVQVPGEDAELFCIDVDISERKRYGERLQSANSRLEVESRRAIQLAEAAEAANRAKSAFLANMSHEIRTPMNGVIGMLSIMLDSEMSSEQREQLDLVYNSAEALLQILNEVLDFSKIEAGKMVLHLDEFHLCDFIDNLIQSVDPRATQKGLKLINAIDPSVPSVVIGDSTRIRQVLNSLIHNAIKFTNHGKVSVTLRRSPESNPTGACMLQFVVEDTGIGIPADKLSTVFERFEQVDNSNTRAYGGTGLGLAIARQLAELMGGSLSVESQLGEGSCFTFNVELQAAELPSFAADIGRPLPTPILSGKVLLADDSLINRTVAVRMLKRLGLQVDAVKDGHAACQAVAVQKYDLILLDIEMPEFDGISAARLIREMEGEETAPDRRRIPILALTAHVLAEHRDACREAGMDGFIAKPVSFPAIAETVAQWLPQSTS